MGTNPERERKGQPGKQARKQRKERQNTKIRNVDAMREDHHQEGGLVPSLPRGGRDPVNAVKLELDVKLETATELRTGGFHVPSEKQGRMTARKWAGLELGVDNLSQGDRRGRNGGQGGDGEVDSSGILRYLLQSLGPMLHVNRDNGGGRGNNSVRRGGSNKTPTNGTNNTCVRTSRDVGLEFRPGVEGKVLDTGLLRTTTTILTLCWVRWRAAVVPTIASTSGGIL